MNERRVLVFLSAAALAVTACTGSASEAPVQPEAPESQPAAEPEEEPEPALPPPSPGPELSFLVVDKRGGCVVADGAKISCWGPDFTATIAPTELTRAVELGRSDSPIVDVHLRTSRLCVAHEDGQRVCYEREREGVIERETATLPEGTTAIAHFTPPLTEVYCTLAQGVLQCNDTTLAEGVLDIDATERELCAIGAEGRLSCWAFKKLDKRLDVDWVPHAAQIEAGSTLCVRTTNDALWCRDEPGKPHVLMSRIGRRDLRELPSGTTTPDFDLASEHLCRLTSEGEIWCRGRNGLAQLGAGDSEVHDKPVRVPLPARATELAVGEGLGCAIVAEEAGGESVWCWGSLAMSWGPLPHESVVHELETSAVFADKQSSCVRLSNDELRCWGSSTTNMTGNEEGGIVAASQPLPATAARSPVDVYQGGGLLSREMFVYGKVLHLATDRETETELRYKRSGIEAFAATDYFACTLASKTRELRCAYEDFDSDSDRLRSWSRAPTLRKVQDLAMDNAEVCAIVGGQVSCAAISEGSRGWKKVPGIKDAIAIAHTLGGNCAVRASGAATCWFSLHKGGRLITKRMFDLEGIDDAVDITSGFDEVCVRTATGAVRCAKAEQEESEVRTVIEAGAVEVAQGSYHLCARMDLDTDGVSERVECHGQNRYGQLGALGAHVLLAPKQIELGGGARESG